MTTRLVGTREPYHLGITAEKSRPSSAYRISAMARSCIRNHDLQRVRQSQLADTKVRDARRENRHMMAARSCHTGPHLSRPAPPKYENVIVLPQTNQLIALLTICRDKTTSRADFIFYANRIIRLLVEEGTNPALFFWWEKLI